MSRADVDSLRTRVAELEGERRRQRRRLDDVTARLVALEGRTTRSSGPRRELPVVRVRPEDARRAEAAPEDEDVRLSEAYAASRAAASEPETDDGERPVLRLYETPELAGAGSPRRSGSRSIELAAVTERLPVVPMPDGDPGPAPLSGDEGEAGEVLALPPEPTVSVDESVRQARGQVGAGDCGAALQTLDGVLASSPEHPLADDAMVLRAQCFRRQGAHLRAIGELERMARRYPTSDRQADALLLRAESYAAIGDRDLARDLFGQVMRRYPRSQAASRATARVQELSRGTSATEEP